MNESREYQLGNLWQPGWTHGQDVVAHNGFRLDFPTLRKTLAYYNLREPLFRPTAPIGSMATASPNVAKNLPSSSNAIRPYPMRGACAEVFANAALLKRECRPRVMTQNAATGKRPAFTRLRLTGSAPRLRPPFSRFPESPLKLRRFGRACSSNRARRATSPARRPRSPGEADSG